MNATQYAWVHFFLGHPGLIKGTKNKLESLCCTPALSLSSQFEGPDCSINIQWNPVHLVVLYKVSSVRSISEILSAVNNDKYICAKFCSKLLSQNWSWYDSNTDHWESAVGKRYKGIGSRYSLTLLARALQGSQETTTTMRNRHWAFGKCLQYLIFRGGILFMLCQMCPTDFIYKLAIVRFLP